MKPELSTVQVESEQWTIHSSNQTQLEKEKPRPLPPHPQEKKKGRLLHSLMRLLIGCMEIKLAVTIFGLD